MLERHGYQKSLAALETCVELNFAVIQEIIADVSELFENAQMMSEGGEGDGATGRVAIEFISS